MGCLMHAGVSGHPPNRERPGLGGPSSPVWNAVLQVGMGRETGSRARGPWFTEGQTPVILVSFFPAGKNGSFLVNIAGVTT